MEPILEFRRCQVQEVLRLAIQDFQLYSQRRVIELLSEDEEQKMLWESKYAEVLQMSQWAHNRTCAAANPSL